MQFDEEFFSVSRKIWNRYGMTLRYGVLRLADEDKLRNIYHHLRSPHTVIFDMAVKSACAVIEIYPSRGEEIFEDLLRFYHTEMVKVKQLNLDELVRTGDDNNFEGNKRFNRIALPQIVKICANLVPHGSVQKLLEFFVTTGSIDTSSDVSITSLEAAEAIVHARGNDYSGRMLTILENFIDNAEDYQEESVHHAVSLIGTLAGYLDK